MQILLKLLNLQIRYNVRNNISANRKINGDIKHITQRFYGGEKPFGKITPPLQNLDNVLSSTQGYNTLAMQVQQRQHKTPVETHSTNNTPLHTSNMKP
jgi:hypothetical protein